MSVLLRIFPKAVSQEYSSAELISKLCRNFSHKLVSDAPVSEPTADEEEFRVFQLIPKKKAETRVKKTIKQFKGIPRYKEMPIDQDWMNVWPGPRSFHPATVPLPVHQGFPKPHEAPPGKFANAELMKIPNFLHLTPPAIAKHCQVLKKFCTKWPEELTNDEAIDENYPISVITADYCHSSPTIRDPDARIISLKLKLSSLTLDSHARDKFLRLIGNRYDPETDIVTITTDSCPVRKQNYDYALYLLTALYHESWIHEDWEKEKSDIDMEVYIWEKRQCCENVKKLFEYCNQQIPATMELAVSVENLLNADEDLASLDKYKQSVVELLSLPKLPQQ